VKKIRLRNFGAPTLLNHFRHQAFERSPPLAFRGPASSSSSCNDQPQLNTVSRRVLHVTVHQRHLTIHSSSVDPSANSSPHSNCPSFPPSSSRRSPHPAPHLPALVIIHSRSPAFCLATHPISFSLPPPPRYLFLFASTPPLRLSLSAFSPRTFPRARSGRGGRWGPVQTTGGKWQSKFSSSSHHFAKAWFISNSGRETAACKLGGGPKWILCAMEKILFAERRGL